MTPVATDLCHPFHAITALPLAQAVPLALVVERGGAYIRLRAEENRILLKKRSESVDAIDRIRFDGSKRIDLLEAVFAAGSNAALHTLLGLLETAREGKR